MDCTIIGGGVIGLTVARRLARTGFRVTLCDRGPCGREASWAGAGVLSPPNPHRQDAAAALLLRSLAMYPTFCQELRDETGIDPEYDRCGEIELAFDEAGVRTLLEDVAASKARRIAGGELGFEMLTREQGMALEPAVSSEMLGGMICRETAQVRNPRLLRALHESCLRGGVVIRENAPAVDLVESQGRVVGVKLGPEGREVIQADRVVLCAGAWSSQITARLTATMPVHPVRGQMILMKLDARPFAHIIARGKTYLVPRRDGHVLLGATEEPEAGYSKRCTAKGIAGLITRGVKLVPSIADAPVVATWAGLRPGTPDDLPYLGPVPGLDGLIAATGHFRTGLSSAPATAEAVAAIVKGERYEIDLACCCPGRT